MSHLVQSLIPGRVISIPAHAAKLPAAPSVPAPSALLCAASLRAILIAAVLLALLLATLLGSPSPRYLADPALARLLRGMAMVKGLITLVGIAALWWRATWPGFVRRAVVALAAVSAQIAATIWIARLVCVPWAAGLFHVGFAVLLVCAWREHRAEADWRAAARPR